MSIRQAHWKFKVLFLLNGGKHQRKFSLSSSLSRSVNPLFYVFSFSQTKVKLKTSSILFDSVDRARPLVYPLRTDSESGSTDWLVPDQYGSRSLDEMSDHRDQTAITRRTDFTDSWFMEKNRKLTVSTFNAANSQNLYLRLYWQPSFPLYWHCLRFCCLLAVR